jgi:sugar lactone lactonase YvrE
MVALRSKNQRRTWLAALLLSIACAPRAPEPTTPAVTPTQQRLDFDGDPNGLFWDAANQTLLIADAAHGRIVRWTDAGGFAPFLDLAAGAEGEAADIGQLVMTSNGTLFVTRFGHGKSGGILRVAPGEKPVALPDLNPQRRRIGLTINSDGRIFDTWFKRHGEGEGEREGGISEVRPDEGEIDIIAGLAKPVGVLATKDKLFFSDQELGQVLSAPLATPAARRVFAKLPEPDLLTAGPDDSILVASKAGSVQRIDAAGNVTALASGWSSVRGVAYDAEHRRFFAAEHAGKGKDAKHALHIVPVN